MEQVVNTVLVVSIQTIPKVCSLPSVLLFHFFSRNIVEVILTPSSFSLSILSVLTCLLRGKGKRPNRTRTINTFGFPYDTCLKRKLKKKKKTYDTLLIERRTGGQLDLVQCWPFEVPYRTLLLDSNLETRRLEVNRPHTRLILGLWECSRTPSTPPIDRETDEWKDNVVIVITSYEYITNVHCLWRSS